MAAGFDAAEKSAREALKEARAVTTDLRVPAEERAKRLGSLASRIEEALAPFLDAPAANERALAALLVGAAAASLPNSAGRAEELLTRALKLSPSLVEGWVELAKLYWQKRDLRQARSCFEGALERANGKSKEALRGLSVVLRNLPSDDEKQRLQNVAQSAALAKKAVALDVTDGESWCALMRAFLSFSVAAWRVSSLPLQLLIRKLADFLGNAHLALFFALTRDPEDLSRALKAYERALASAGGGQAGNADLFFNRGNVYAFQENFIAALQDYARAAELDPLLGAQEKRDELRRYVARVARLVHSSGGVKPKRLRERVAGLSPPAAPLLRAPAAADPAGAPAAQPPPPPLSLHRRAVALRDLREGPNPGMALSLLVLAPVSRESDVPVTFIVADSNCDVRAVSLYNVSAAALSAVKVDDELSVADPRCCRVDLEIPGDNAEGAQPLRAAFEWLQISDPASVLVNGKASVLGKPAFPVATFQAQ